MRPGCGRSPGFSTLGDLASCPLFVAAFALTFLLGLLTVYLPGYGDQVLFLLGAMEIDHGSKLYADFWDTKQPGIFWFYWLAGKLVGFRIERVYLFALAWLLATALLLTSASAIELKNRHALTMVPLLSTGLFFWNADIQSPAQVEVLVSLPLAGCVLLGITTIAYGRHHTLAYFGFGVCSALIAIFKLMLLVVPACIWCCLAWTEYRERGRTLAWIGTRMLIPTALGTALPLSLTALYFYWIGAWEKFRWTTFEFPRLAMMELPAKPIRHLLGSTASYVLIIFPALPLAALLCTDLRRERLRLIEVLAITWIAAGFGVIALQRVSWWGYHFALLLAPSGVLIASLLDRLTSVVTIRMGTLMGAVHSRALTAAFLVTFFGLSHSNGIKMLNAARTALAGSSVPVVQGYQRAIDPKITGQQAEASFLNSKTNAAERIYVFGDPRIILWSGRRYALAINGWSWESLPQLLWNDLPRQLAVAAPTYISISDFYVALISKRSPQTVELLNTAYELTYLNGQALYRLKRP